MPFFLGGGFSEIRRLTKWKVMSSLRIRNSGTRYLNEVFKTTWFDPYPIHLVCGVFKAIDIHYTHCSRSDSMHFEIILESFLLLDSFIMYTPPEV